MNIIEYNHEYYVGNVSNNRIRNYLFKSNRLTSVITYIAYTGTKVKPEIIKL